MKPVCLGPEWPEMDGVGHLGTGRAQRWFTSDFHFGHERICALSNRPFDTVDHMNAALIDRFNSVVDPDDEVWILGDVCMGQIMRSLKLIPQLHGSLNLVLGNHDRCGKAWADAYLDAGFAAIYISPVRETLEDEAGTIPIVLSHFPWSTSEGVGERPVRVDYGNAWLLHGHLHEKARVLAEIQQINVGVDVWDFLPVSERVLAATIRFWQAKSRVHVVRATPAGRWWVLDGLTALAYSQVADLADAAGQMRKVISTVEGVDPDTVRVQILVEGERHE